MSGTKPTIDALLEEVRQRLNEIQVVGRALMPQEESDLKRLEEIEAALRETIQARAKLTEIDNAITMLGHTYDGPLRAVIRFTRLSDDERADQEDYDPKSGGLVGHFIDALREIDGQILAIKLSP